MKKILSSQLLKNYLEKYKKPSVLVVGPNLYYYDDPSVIFISNWMKKNNTGSLIVADSQLRAEGEKKKKNSHDGGSGDLTVYERSFRKLLKFAPNSFLMPDLKRVPDAAELLWNDSIDLIVDHNSFSFFLESFITNHSLEKFAEARGKRILEEYSKALRKNGKALIFYHVPAQLSLERFRKAHNILLKSLKGYKRKTIRIEDKYKISMASLDELWNLRNNLHPRFLKQGVRNNQTFTLRPVYECEKVCIMQK